MKAKITVIVFLVLLGGLAILNLTTPDKEFSENENRYLQQMPTFTWDSLVDGKFTADFDSYVTDQFVLRDGWVGMKTLCELALQKRASNGVYFAKDDTLIEMFSTVDLDQYGRNLGLVGDFSQRVEGELGVRVNTMLVPTPSMILSDKLPANAPEVDQRQLLDTAATSLPGFVDVSEALAARNDEYIYYATDHHWTSLGALYSYSHWREQLGEVSVPLSDFVQETLSDSFFGTTYSKASLYTVPPDTIYGMLPSDLGPIQVDYNRGETITDTIYERSYLTKKDKYSVFLNANQSVTHITTGDENGKKLLLIKDSYANTFAQMALGDYSEIYLIDLRYFKLSAYEYIRENSIDDVLILYSMNGFSSDTNLFYLST